MYETHVYNSWDYKHVQYKLIIANTHQTRLFRADQLNQHNHHHHEQQHYVFGGVGKPIRYHRDSANIYSPKQKTCFY